MCTSMAGDLIQTAAGQRTADGVFTPDRELGIGQKWKDRHPAYRKPQPTDVPLGDGMLDAGSRAIQSRRERIREALGE